MFQFLKKKKKFGCPNCFEKNIVGFGLDYLQSEFQSTIKVYDEIGNIRLHRCEKCAAIFNIHENMCEKKLPVQVEFLKKWSQKREGCHIDFKKQIDLIGLTQNWNSQYSIPCKVELNNGQIFDFATLLFTNQPPIGIYYSNYENFFFIDEVKLIMQSEYALSKDIRLACLKAEEKRMGFYPTVVKNRENAEVVIRGTSLFFNYNNIKGADLVLANKEWNYKDNYVYDLGKEEKTLVIVKE